MCEDDNFYWSVSKYIKLVENTVFPALKKYEKTELDYITTKVHLPHRKTFIDVGAGYGRVLPQIAQVAKKLIAVEMDQNMLAELRRRSSKYNNVHVLKGNGNYLVDLLQNKDISNPIFICLQNSLGTWKGDYQEAIREMKSIAQRENGEILISLFCQEALVDMGIPMYLSASKLVGEPDLERTDFINGVFRSKTGYKSKWWRPEERMQISRLLGGEKVGEINGPNFWIIHTVY